MTTTKVNTVKQAVCECGHVIKRGKHLIAVPNGQYVDTLAYCQWCGKSFLAERTPKHQIAKEGK